MNSRGESLPATPRAPAKASPGLRKAGRIAYRYRQAMQLVLLAVALLLGRSLGSVVADQTLLVSAFLLVVLGGALRSWAMGYHVWRRVYGPGSERSLVTAGPYAVTRNPLYLGTFMIGCGIAAMSGWAALLAAFVIVFVPVHYSIIRWEEGKLVEEFPGEFPRYASQVPRLFPGLRWATQRAGRFDLRTMVRCMEPVKTLGFVAVIFLMHYLKTRGWTPLL